jgi:hypothetical protein
MHLHVANAEHDLLRRARPSSTVARGATGSTAAAHRLGGIVQVTAHALPVIERMP